MSKYSGPGAAWSISQLPSERDDGIYDLRGARSFPTLEDEGKQLCFHTWKYLLNLVLVHSDSQKCKGCAVYFQHGSLSTGVYKSCLNEGGLCFVKGVVQNGVSFELTLFCFNTEPLCGSMFFLLCVQMF